MDRIITTIITLLVVLPANLSLAEPRPWKSADGIRTVTGELVKREPTQITIRTEAGKEIVIELGKLHPDEIKSLDAQQQAPGKKPAEESTSGSFFDNLTFRDTRETTLEKLKASKVVEMTTSETFIGRSGLNGIFRTREKIGSLSGFLYFDWTPGGTLKELTLQTETLPGSDYKTTLQPCWKQFIELLSTLYGKPIQQGVLPSMESIPDGAFYPSHLWKLETGGSALLGTARDGAKYQIVVRFSEKVVKPVALD